MKIKKIIAFLILLLVGYTVSAQTKIKLGKEVSFDLPIGTRSFDDSEYYKSLEPIIGKEMVEVKAKQTEVYKINNIVLRFRVVKFKPETNYISEMNNVWQKTYNKSENRNLYRNFKSEIKNVNGNQILKGQFIDNKGNLTYEFINYNPTNKKSFSCEIISPLNEQKQVEEILELISKSSEFYK